MKQEKHICFLLVLLGFLTIISCGNPMNKIAHKWVVVSAKWYDTSTRKIQIIDDHSLYARRFEGQIYDLHSDGTYSSHDKVENKDGKWKIRFNNAIFTDCDGNKHTWYFLGQKLEIHPDSTMVFKLDNESNQYYLLTIKAAPGEDVNVDNYW